MSRQPILVGKDGDGVHSEFMGSTEDADCNFLEIDEHSPTILRAMRRTPRLATRILVNGPPWPAAFLLMVWME